MAKIIKNGIEYGGNTDNKVTQTATNTSTVYEVLFSGSNNNTTATEGVRKTDTLVYNPGNYNFASKCTSVDTSKTNNDISSNVWYPMMSVFDKSNRIATRIETAFYTNGDVKSSFLTRQYDTNGDQVANKGISMTMNKSGNLTYSVADPANFRSAIGLGVTNISSLYKITKTSGNWKVTEIGAVRSGNTVHMRVEMSGNGNSVNAAIKLIAFYNSCPIMLNIEPDGAIVARVTATNVTVTSSGTLVLTGTFITNN